jgi:hypothetical protein
MRRSSSLFGLSALCLGMGMAVSVRAQEGEQPSGDSCEKCMFIKAGKPDFCDTHKLGIAYGVELKSRKLYDALAGERLDREKVMACPGCKKASEEGGRCDTHNMCIVVPRGYKSPVACSLAKGREVQHDAALRCESCKKAWAEDGTCAECKHHFAGHSLYKTEADQKAAVAALAVLKQAAAAPCEDCAAAMVLDGKCEKCNASYKDGKKA